MADTHSRSVSEATNYKCPRVFILTDSFCHTETQGNLFTIKLLLTKRAFLQLPYSSSAMCTRAVLSVYAGSISSY